MMVPFTQHGTGQMEPPPSVVSKRQRLENRDQNETPKSQKCSVRASLWSLALTAPKAASVRR